MDTETFQTWYGDLQMLSRVNSLIRCLLLEGSIILSVEPHVFVLSNQYLDSHCGSCANTAPMSPLMRCSGCGTLRYCNNVSS